MNRDVQWLSLALLSAGAFACGDGTSASRVWTVADTTVVESLRPLIADTLHPREVTRYGRASGNDEYLFGDIFAFAIGPNGDVYVHDRDNGIRGFRRDGEFAGYVAGFGQGPNEVDYVLGMDVTPDGRVVAVDLGSGRISVFGPNGEGWSRPRGAGRPRYNGEGVQVHSDGSIWIGIHPPFPSDGIIRHPRPVFARLSPEGALVDTFYTPADAASGCPVLSEANRAQGFWEDRREPFVPKAKWTLGPDGTFVVGCPSEYQFDVHSPDRGVLRIRRAWTASEVPQEARDFFATWVDIDVPEELPAYARIIVPGDGRVWVWPSQPPVQEPLSQALAATTGLTHTWVIPWEGSFDVFDERGRWLAVVLLPQGARYSGYPTEPPVVIRGDTLWAVAHDELGIEYVVRYEVEGLDP